TSRTRAGISVRRCQLEDADRVTIRRLPVTSIKRTLRDFCISSGPVEALVAIDMAVRRGSASSTALTDFANRSAGVPGSARLRKLAALAEPAESPMETRLRWLLIDSGLPRPEVQVNLHDQHGELIARADLYYPEA